MVNPSPEIRANTQARYLAQALDEPRMARLLRRHGLHGGRTTIVLLLLFEGAGLPLAVVRDFLGTLGDLAEPKVVYQKGLSFIREMR